MRKTWICLLLLLLAPMAARAGHMDVMVEIPHPPGQYHRPYVAVWIEDGGHHMMTSLSVWYDTRSRSEDGRKWLKDLRQWWRRGGRGMDMPVDGVSGATRPAGQHRLRFSTTEAPLKDLEPGRYVLVLEAARELGGREVLRIPFTWPAGQSVHLEARGQRELGRATLDIDP